MNRIKIKALTESGLLTALTVIFALISVYVPIIGAVAILIWPLPLIVLVVRHGIRMGLLATLAATVVMSIMITPALAIRLVISFALPGLVLGYGFYQNWSASKNLLIGLGAATVSSLMAMFVVFLLTDINPLAEQMDILKDSFDTSLSFYETMGMSASELEQSKQSLSIALNLVSQLLPMVIILSALMVTLINFTLGNIVLRRLNYKVNGLPAFSNWRFPKACAYAAGFAAVGMYWGWTRDINLLYQVSLNLLTLSMFAGFVQGAALLRAISDRFRVHRVFYYCLMVFIFLSGLPAQVLAFIGIVDMVFDYRKRLNINQQ